MSVMTTGLRRQLLACVIATALAGCGGERSEAEYIASGNAYVANNQHAAAIIEFKNALQQNPGNAALRLQLAASYLVVGDGAGAEKELLRAAELGAASSDVLLPLVRALMIQGKSEDVVKQTTQLDSQPPEKRLILHILRGQSLVNLGREDEARAEFELANELDPQAPMARLGSAYVKVFNDETDEAMVALDALLADEPSLEEAWLLKARLQMARGDAKGGAESFETLLKLAPQVMGYRLLYAESLIQAQRYDDAKKELASLRKQLKTHPIPLYYEAVIAFHERDCDTTLDRAGQVLQQLPQHLNSRLLSGYCYYLKGQPQLAYEFLQNTAPQTPPNHMARKVLALTEFKLGYHEAAAETMRGYQGNSAEDFTLFSDLGGALIREGRPNEARELLERASKGEGEDTATRIRLGMAKLAMDDDAGLTDLEQVMTDDPKQEGAKVLLALNLMKRDRVDEARKLADDWLAAEPDNIDAVNLSALVARQAGDGAKAQALLSRALELAPTNRNTRTQLLQLALQNKDIGKVREQIQVLLEAAPSSPQLIVLWMAAETAQGDISLVADYLQKRIAAAGTDVDDARVALAGIRLRAGNLTEVESLLAPIAIESPRYVDALLLRGQALVNDGKVGEAEKLFRSWRDAKPDDARSYLALSEFYKIQGQLDKAVAETRAGLNRYPKGSALLMMMASLQLQRGDVDAAAEAITVLDREKVDNPLANELRGRVALGQGKPKLAVEPLRQAQAAQPSATRVVYLGQALLANGQRDEARTLLEAEVAATPTNAAARNVLANIYLATDPAKAIAQYREVVAIQPENVMALNNLAWLLGEQGDTTEALVFAQQAQKVLPDNPMVLDTLGALQFKAGKADLALPLLEKANASLPKDPNVRLHLAAALVATGDKAKAREHLEALRAAPDFGSKAELDALWEKSR